MGFIPPLNLGNFQPSPATLSQWIYQIWQYLQENPIATQEQLEEYIATFITTSPEAQAMIGEGVEQYLTDNPPQAPVQSVQGKTGAVTLAFNDILKNNNTAPVYRAASMPSQSTLQAQYNLGYRLFVNTTTQEIYSITNTGSTTLVGKGKFDGTTVDLNASQGDTTIAEAVEEINTKFGQIGTITELLTWGNYAPGSTVRTLADSILNYDVIMVRSGSSTDQASGGGAYQAYFYNVRANDMYGAMFSLNGDLVNYSFTFTSNTQVTITHGYNHRTQSAYTGTVVRAIYGIKLKQ